MSALITWQLLGLALSSLVLGAEKHARIPLARRKHEISPLRRRSTSGSFSFNRLPVLYWVAPEFEVGDSKNVTLVVGTGSSDVILDPKVYVYGPLI